MEKTIVHGRFEWDEGKNQKNIKKHGFGFEDILDMFEDPFFYEIYDSMHSAQDEDRYIGIGSVQGVLVVTACYAERGKKIRIFSSRLASPSEERLYYGEKKNFFK